MAARNPSIFKVALIQLHPKTNDPEANFQTASSYIRQGAQQAPGFIATASLASKYIERYQIFASDLTINIVPGTIVQNVSEPEDNAATGALNPRPVLHKVAPFVSHTGEVLGSYVKQNLWHPERAHLSPAFSGIQRQRESESPVRLLVCWDIGFPEAFRLLIGQGARIIICPTYWLTTDMSKAGLKLNPDAEAVFMKSVIVARACENTCCIVFVKGGGPKEDGFLGLSQVAMPLVGTVGGSFTGCEGGMRIVQVDMRLVDVAEANYQVREDLSRQDWHYGYSHA